MDGQELNTTTDKKGLVGIRCPHCGWLGNSAKIATDHYLKITPEHLERALQGVGQGVRL